MYSVPVTVWMLTKFCSLKFSINENLPERARKFKDLVKSFHSAIKILDIMHSRFGRFWQMFIFQKLRWEKFFY